MKKKRRIRLMIGLIIMICIITALFNRKTAITAEKFKTTMEAKGFTVTDVTNQFASHGDYVTKAYIAQDDENYQIEFYELSNLENATNFYHTNKKNFELQEANASKIHTIDRKKSAIYSIIANGRYKYLSRIDNTVIYIDESTSYQTSIQSVIKKLGY